MADVELVIKIPEEVYEEIKNGVDIEIHYGENIVVKDEWASERIRNGKRLPKGHGKLIDAKEYENSIRKHYFDNHTVIRCTEIALYSAETIVKADKN